MKEYYSELRNKSERAFKSYLGKQIWIGDGEGAKKVKTCKENGIKSPRSYEILSHNEVGFRGFIKYIHL